ncbi:MAG TPA: hypothetical protein DCZ91_07110 [Lachnospiraceae bacterium]|nr:hypothetical protein [Lachnospiraceae bacterium]
MTKETSVNNCCRLYQQHSCGAVGPIIPELIECGVDALKPLQKVVTLEPETLAANYACYPFAPAKVRTLRAAAGME